MTRDEIVALVRDALGFYDNLSTDIIYRHMNRVQEKYEYGHDQLPIPWFLFDDDATAVTVAGQRYAELPDGFINFDENWPLTILTSDSVTKPLDRRGMYDLVADTDLSGFPEYYELSGNVINLFPKPDAVYTINIPCYVAGTALGSTTSSEWYVQLADLLIEETAFSIAKAKRDKGFMQTSDINQKRVNYITRVEARMHTLKQYQVGGSVA